MIMKHKIICKLPLDQERRGSRLKDFNRTQYKSMWDHCGLQVRAFVSTLEELFAPFLHNVFVNFSLMSLKVVLE